MKGVLRERKKNVAAAMKEKRGPSEGRGRSKREGEGVNVRFCLFFE